MKQELIAKLNENKNIVFYRKPNQENIYLGVEQKQAEDKWIIQDFYAEEYQEIPMSFSKWAIEDFKFLNINPENYTLKSQEIETSQEDYLSYVKETLSYIEKTNCHKIVPSRVKQLENKNFNIIKTFQALLESYKTAFCYLMFIKGKGVWMGASPETLFKIKENQFETMSLAGTKLKSKNREWTDKEYREQKLVTDYLVDKLDGKLDSMNVSEVFTSTAASLEHLKTNIKGHLKPNVSIEDLDLHPTPAVCGLPKKIAFDFIRNKEGLNRKLYAGFLAVKIHNEMNAYVNIRSLQLTQKTINLYAGGGVLKGSIPKKEWEETEHKLAVMKAKLKYDEKP